MVITCVETLKCSIEAVSHGVHVAIRGHQRQLEAVSHGVHVAGEMHRRLCKEATRLGDDPGATRDR